MTGLIERLIKYIYIVCLTIMLCLLGFAFYIFYIVGFDEFIYPTQQPFRVFGEPAILNNMVINVESISGKADKSVAVKTALYKGKQFEFGDKHIAEYNIYISYHNSVAKLYIEHWMYKFDKRHINNIYVIQQGKQVYIKYINDINRKHQYLKSSLTVSLDDYFKENNVVGIKEQQQLKQKFFNFYGAGN